MSRIGKRNPGLHAKRATQAGQAMVEFVLVIVFLFILFISVIQTILMMYAYTTLANAAKEGVRYAVVHGTGRNKANCSGPGNPFVTPALTCTDSTGANIQATVTNFGGLSFQNVATSDVTVCYDPDNASPPACSNGANTNNPSFGQACSAPGCLVRVSVSHTYNPFFGFSWPAITLNAAADGRIMN